MADLAEIAADPRWLPHTLDPAGRRILFVHVERARLAEPAFLADVDAATVPSQWLSFEQVMELQPEPGPLHFIFHTAFCRSTLLVRALEIEGVSAGLAEPGIIAQLAGAGNGVSELVKPVCDLLSRPWGKGEAVFVKPTNRANMLIPALLAARPDASAVLMSNPLPRFLQALDRRALMGRRWGRQLYLEIMSYAGMDLGMDAREQFCMTDLQAGGLAWFLSQRYFAMLAGGPHKARLRTLDGEGFNLYRADTLAAVAQLAGLALPPERAEAIAKGPLFARHAKLGSDFSEAEGSALAPSLEQEIGQVEQWIGMIAQQAGIAVPLPQTLF